MTRKIFVTISMDERTKNRLRKAVEDRHILNNKLGSWDDLMNYLAYIIENKIDLK